MRVLCVCMYPLYIKSVCMTCIYIYDCELAASPVVVVACCSFVSPLALF